MDDCNCIKDENGITQCSCAKENERCTKVTVEFKGRRNYNSFSIRIEDEPIYYVGKDNLRKGLKELGKFVRECVEEQLNMMGMQK